MDKRRSCSPNPAEDSTNRYPYGGAGFRVDCGTMMVDDIAIFSASEP